MSVKIKGIHVALLKSKLRNIRSWIHKYFFLLIIENLLVLI